MEIEITCPLGSKCEEAVDGKIKRCAWFTYISGKHPQKEGDIEEAGCAIMWTPLLLLEVAQTNRGQTSAIESFRNETVRQQDTFIGMAKKKLEN